MAIGIVIMMTIIIYSPSLSTEMKVSGEEKKKNPIEWMNGMAIICWILDCIRMDFHKKCKEEDTES